MSKKHSPGNSISGDVAAKLKSFVLDQLNLYVTTAIQIKDDELAKSYLVKSVTSAFNSAFKGRLTWLDYKIKAKETNEKKAEENLESVSDEKDKTDERIPSSRANRDKEDADRVQTYFPDWQHRHKVEYVLLIILIALAVLASFTTAYTNLVGTKIKVFMDYPMLAVSMAMLAPLSAFAIKSIYGFLSNGWPKKTYTFSLVTAMLVSEGLWILLYADSYHGLSPSVSGGGIFEDATLWEQVRDTTFIVVSLTTEILIGAVFAVRYAIIELIYSPDSSYTNERFVALEKREDALTKRLSKLGDELIELRAERAALDAELEGYIQTALLTFEGRRGQTPPAIL